MGDQHGAMDGLPCVGETFAGKYQVERILGSGAMGVVVGARHIDLEQPVAIKFMRPEIALSTDSIARFLREARAAARIQSEHVVRIHDVGRQESGTPYMVMEHLVGSDLDQIVRAQGPMQVEVAVEYVLQTCEAIAEAHSRGIVHRDLKPSNLFLTRRADGSPLVKVLDFGISKVTMGQAGALDANLTRTSEMFGTPLYMSPEQVRNSKKVDGRTDIWALGVILHELLTADHPFEADMMPACLAKIVADPPVPLRARRPDAPPGLEALILGCLEKDVRLRFQNVADLAKGLCVFGPARCQTSVERIRGVLLGSNLSAERALEDPASRGADAAVTPPGPAVTAAHTQDVAALTGQSDGLASGCAAGRDSFNASAPPLSSSQPAAPLALQTASAGAAITPRMRWKVALAAGAGTMGLAGWMAVQQGFLGAPALNVPGATMAPTGVSAASPQGSAEDHAADQASAASPSAAVEAAPQVEITLHVEPSGALIELDGTAAESPLRLPRSDRVYQLVVRAPGYAPLSQPLRADTSRELSLVLTPEKAGGASQGRRAATPEGDAHHGVPVAAAPPRAPPIEAPGAASPKKSKTPAAQKVTGPLETAL